MLNNKELTAALDRPSASVYSATLESSIVAICSAELSSGFQSTHFTAPSKLSKVNTSCMDKLELRLESFEAADATGSRHNDVFHLSADSVTDTVSTRRTLVVRYVTQTVT